MDSQKTITNWQCRIRGRGGRLAAAVLLLALAGCSAQTDVDRSTPAAASASVVPRGETRIELVPTSDDGRLGFAVSGLSAEELVLLGRLEAEKLAGVLRVYAASELAAPPPILGEAKIAEKSLQFTPRYDLQPGLRYRAVFDRAALHGNSNTPAGSDSPDQQTAEFEIHADATAEPTVVTQTFPTTNQLPENQLKFYIHFSAPMGRGEAYRHIHLYDAGGKEVEAAFLELTEELWDRDLRRFTLLCDPGRVKQELKPREELGPVLQRGKSYRLVIDRDWRDARGNPLAAGREKTFDVLPAVSTPIDSKSWQIEPPEAGSQQPVVVRFTAPLDHALLERVVGIRDASGTVISGTISISEQETCWEFTPEVSWKAGEYQLVAATTLEDLAGNSIGRAFEVDVTQPAEVARNSPAGNGTISIPFRILAAGETPTE